MDRKHGCSGARAGGRKPERGLGSQAGAQLVELALALPILLLLVVGGWDFGKAYLLNEKLTNAAREAARVSASNSVLPDPNCTASIPCSIEASANVVVQYLTDAGLSVSCISPGSPTTTGTLTWTWSCGSGVSLTINRSLTATVGTVLTPEVQVSLSYPFKWQLATFLPKNTFPSVVSTAYTMAILTF
jgi:Flp pilus assembly protein TadG